MTTAIHHASVPREFHVTIKFAKELIKYLVAAGTPVMLWSSPGIGKTSVVYQLAQEVNENVVEFKTNIREPVDVRGVPALDHETQTTKWFVPDELPQVKRDGKSGWLLIDEINTGTTQMMAVMMGLVLERRIGDYHLMKEWKIVATGNSVSDRAAAQRMPTALRNRFAHIHIIPDVDAWAEWCTENKVEPEMVAFIRFKKEYLHMMPKGDENAFPTPRSLVAAAPHVKAPEHLRVHLFAAHIGPAVAGELDAFISLYRSFGALDDIIKDPVNYKLPTEPSLKYAVSTGLARMADKKTMKAIMTYAARLGRESEVLVMHDATLRDKALKNTPEYGAWAVANQHLTVQ